ncbi:MAG: ribosomal subunit interface protein [Gammaproteobacteria bacterium MedPE]|nr:MAG: ribosomal subunit interface protein [Gammaproteobacteria bacterium MedPE]
MYKVNISGQHVSVSDEVVSYVKESISSLERFSDQITSVNVNFTTEKHDTHKIIAEAQIHIPGADIFATSTADRHITSAIDGLLSKLENQMRKHKSKQLDKAHSGNKSFVETDEEREKQDEFNALADRGIVTD